MPYIDISIIIDIGRLQLLKYSVPQDDLFLTRAPGL